MNPFWLKPMMIVLAIFAFVVLLITLDDASLWSVTWSGPRDIVIALLPFLVPLGLGLFILVYVMGRK